MVNSDVVAPIPSAITSTDTIEKLGERHNVRTPYLRSRSNRSSQFQVHTARVCSRITVGISESAHGGETCLFRRQAAFPLLFFFQFKVSTGVPSPAPRPAASAATIAYPLSPAAGHSTRPTASVIWFYSDSSTTSCFLPLSINR